jgi:hypothetical protein
MTLQANLANFLASISSGPVPADVREWPSMMVPGEKELLHVLARDYFRGEGVIVDAGVFLGASTHAFAVGVKANPRIKDNRGAKPINSYEIAIWVEDFARYLTYPGVAEKTAGMTFAADQSYLPQLKNILADDLDVVDLRIGDVVVEARADRPVEIAFYDCLKNYERDWTGFKVFGPHLIPGHSIVIQQDYFFHGAIDLKIRQEALANYFTYLGDVATSAVFRLERPLPDRFFKEDPVLALSAAQRAQLLLQASRRPELPGFQVSAQLAAVLFMIENGLYDQATDELEIAEEIIAERQLPQRIADIAARARTWMTGRRG